MYLSTHTRHPAVCFLVTRGIDPGVRGTAASAGSAFAAPPLLLLVVFFTCVMHLLPSLSRSSASHSCLSHKFPVILGETRPGREEVMEVS